MDWRKYRVLSHTQEALKTIPAEMKAFVNKDLHSNAFTKTELIEYFGVTNEELNEESMSKNTLDGKKCNFCCLVGFCLYVYVWVIW